MLGDFTGLGWFTKYKTGRPLTDEERAAHKELLARQSEFQPNNALSVISMSDECIELADRWYPQKGIGVAMTIPLIVLSLYAIISMIWVAIQNQEAMAYLLSFGVVVTFSGFLWLCWYGFRLEAFRLTHYPLLLNRRTGAVHAFGPDGTTMTSSWKDLYFVIGEETVPAFGKTYDVRAHILDRETGHIKDTFTISYLQAGTKEQTLEAWEFVRQYMEEPQALETLGRGVEFFLPIDERREGAYFGLIRTFTIAARYPVMQLLLSPFLSWITLCRWIAMYSSSVPRWPESVRATEPIGIDSPSRRNWRENRALSFSEGIWPVICFVVGWAALIWGIVSLISLVNG